MAISPALQGSSFTRLSTELRLMIWEFATYSEDGIQLNHTEINDADVANRDDSKEQHSSPLVNDDLEFTVFTVEEDFVVGKMPSILALCQTCRQIRYEAMPIFLEANSFHALCPIFDNSKGHGEVSSDAVQFNRGRIQSWLRSLWNVDESWPSHVKDLTIDLGLWRICGCKSSSKCFVDALMGFSADFPPGRSRKLKVKFAVQWRAICPCCEGETNDESVWPLAFEIVRGENDDFFDAVLSVCEGRAKWILGREGLCGRTRVAWLVQLERASGRLVEIFGELGRTGEFWEGKQDDCETREIVEVHD